MANILSTRDHPAERVDPFGARPCRCSTITIHTTDGEYLGDDIAECVPCGWRLTLAQLYKDHAPPSLVPGDMVDTGDETGAVESGDTGDTKDSGETDEGTDSN